MRNSAGKSGGFMIASKPDALCQGNSPKCESLGLAHFQCGHTSNADTPPLVIPTPWNPDLILPVGGRELAIWPNFASVR